jgi:predicted ATPase/DNA-binding winged helix-turn-helix (wHTH) protein
MRSGGAVTSGEEAIVGAGGASVLKASLSVLNRSERDVGRQPAAPESFTHAVGTPTAGRSPEQQMSAAPYRFLAAELHPAQRTLRVDGRDCQVGARAFDLLLALLERRDRVVAKSELLEVVWPSVIVEENNLQVHISSLRKLLGSGVIATVPGRGYRFVAPVHEGQDLAEPAATANAPAAADLAKGIRERTNLPLHRPVLLGRADDQRHVAGLLASHRLVTVIGAGGIGKSRLAQAVADAELERCRDGVWWVELAALADPDLLPNVVAQQIGLVVAEREAGTQALVDALASRQSLLVLDNCEHLLESVAALVERLLQAAPSLRLLATSQEPLRVVAEQQYRLEPLAVPRDASVPGVRDYGALALLQSRVRAIAPRFELADADLPLAIDLCRQLDGLPLAIELAAARVPLLGLRAVHARVRERFLLLTAGTRTALRRHQTLRAAMDWSHGLLVDAQRAVFRRLGVFSGGFTMELAQAVCGDGGHDEWAVLEQLSALVEKSLVVAEAGEPVRYRLLESPRAFALEQLAAAGETGAVLRLHAAAMLQFLRRVDDGNMDSTLRSGEYAALVLPELDNLRAAYAWAVSASDDRVLAIGLAAHAGPLIDYSTEFAEWLLAQLANLGPGVVDDATAARFWRAMAASNMQGPRTLPELVEAAQSAITAYRALHRPRRLFTALRMLAVWARLAGDIEGSQRAIDEAAALIEPDWAAEFRIVVLRFRAASCRIAGAHEAASDMYGEAIRLAQDAGDWRLEVIERVNACDLLWERGRHDEAARELGAVLASQKERPASDFELVETLSIRLGVLGESGSLDKAVAAAREALPVMRRMPKFRFEPCAQLLFRLGRFEAAARVLGAQQARESEQREPPQVNEGRIAATTMAALRIELAPARLAEELAKGRGLGYADVCDLLAEALAGEPVR